MQAQERLHVVRTRLGDDFAVTVLMEVVDHDAVEARDLAYQSRRLGLQLDRASEPGEVLDGDLRIACGDGVVRLLRVQRAGKAAQTPEEMLRGFEIPVGTVLA